MEMRNKFINRARNVWDRAVVLLPRVDQLWYKYALMEEHLKNYDNARKIFDRWMEWIPDEKGWMSYIKLEMRSKGSKNDKIIRSRKIYDKYIKAYKNEKSYIKYAKWEQNNGDINKTRSIYEMCINDIKNDEGIDLSFEFYKSFAEFEVKCKEYERARVIYKFGLDNIPKYKAQELYNEYIKFEKKYGNKKNIDNVILNKKKFDYENELKNDKNNYDIWFDYIKLYEQDLNNYKTDNNIKYDDIKSESDINDPIILNKHKIIREIYEKAIANVPPLNDKKYWKRYIFLWIKYAIFEELIARNYNRTEIVYKTCLKLLPNNVFTFGKIWIMLAEFYLRMKSLDKFRSTLGTALGICPKKNIFNAYIKYEYQMGNFDRCRELYKKYCETFPYNFNVFIEFASMERTLNEINRARKIFEIGITQCNSLLKMNNIDMIQDINIKNPEILWKGYIEFEKKLKEYNKVRQLFERLLEITKHVKIWISFAEFESSIDNSHKARNIFVRGNDYFKQNLTNNNELNINYQDIIEQRVLLLNGWLSFEQEWGSPEQINNVKKLQPKKVKRRKPIKTNEGNDAGYQEYYDYIFPDNIHFNNSNANNAINIKLLQKAREWKKKMDKQNNNNS